MRATRMTRADLPTLPPAVFDRPVIDFEPYVDLDTLASLDDEICFGLSQVAVDYTGGSHKWMGIVPPSLADEPYADYGQVIAAMSRAEFARFVALSDTPDAFDLDRRQDYEFGEERDWPLSRRQMRYLEYRHGVYFPWKVFYELVPNGRWEERANADDKAFTDEARRLFARTVAFIERLPFERIGRCNLLGLQSNDHGTVHRDSDGDQAGDQAGKAEVGHFMTLCPRGDKRLFLWDERTRTRRAIDGRAYWFDDRLYHGVEAAPYFRYSIRIDGVFTPQFLARLREDLRAGGSP
jgi:hypothetical protein